MLTRHGPLFVFLVDVKFLKETMAGYSGGCTMVLEGRLHSTGQDLVAIGYKYSSRKKSKVLNFIMHPEFGSTKDGVPYEMKFVNPEGRLVARNIDRPQCIGTYYTHSNVVNTHNHLRQSEFGLEESVQTQSCYLRLVTTIIGINVVDTLLMAKKYKLVSQDITTLQFVNILTKQLMDIAMEKKEIDLMRQVQQMKWPHLPEKLGELIDVTGQWLPKENRLMQTDGVVVDSQGSAVSSLSSDKKYCRTNFMPGEFRRDCNGGYHELCISEKRVTTDKNGQQKTYRPSHRCMKKGCHYQTWFYCKNCSAKCKKGEKIWYCAPYDRVDHECFVWHVEDIQEPVRKRARSDL
jgi:hypothetical protein